MILATWLTEAAAEEQTSFVLVTLDVHSVLLLLLEVFFYCSHAKDCVMFSAFRFFVICHCRKPALNTCQPYCTV